MAAPAGKPAKTMSSRLMNMKFMKRTAMNSSPATPSASESEPSVKRRRLADDSPGTPLSVRSRYGEEDVFEEDQGADEILRRQAELAGDTKWELSPDDVALTPARGSLQVTVAGYGVIDSSRQKKVDQEDDDPRQGMETQSPGPGRRSFGKFNKALERQARPHRESDVGSGGSEDCEIDDDDDDPVAEHGYRGGLRDFGAKGGKPRGDKTQKPHADTDRLRKLTSISSGGLSTPSRSGLAPGQACFNCGSPDHRKQDCPKPKRNNSRRK